MRLVELHRASLGLAKPELSAWKSQPPPEGPAVPLPAEASRTGAVLAVELTAQPMREVIPGAIVTVALSVVNEGYSPAKRVRVAVPLPGGATFRNGSLIRNGQPVLDNVAEEFFGDGLALGDIAPRMRATLVWKIGVRLGNKPLVMTPTATAQESAIVGGASISITRREGANAGFTLDVRAASRELPFYELDDEETLEHEAANAALSAAPAPQAEYVPPMEPPTPATPPPAQPDPGSPPMQPQPAEPEQPPDVEPAAREAVVLYGRIDRPSVAYFERVFNGSKPPTLLDHFILGGALACAQPADGDGRNLETHLQAQRQLLQRVLLHEKLGKKEPIGQYTGTLMAHVGGLAPALVRGQPKPAGANEVLLENELDSPTLSLLKKMDEERLRWDFTKARQFTLALQAKRVICETSEMTVRAADDALRAYAHVSGTQLQRFFVRVRLDRTTGLLFTGDATLDACARTLIAALATLFR